MSNLKFISRVESPIFNHSHFVATFIVLSEPRNIKVDRGISEIKKAILIASLVSRCELDVVG